MKYGTALLIGLAFMSTMCARPPTTTGAVEALVSHVVVQPDGSLDVEDRFTIAPDPEGTLAFHHEVESRFADNVHFASAAVDGVPVDVAAGELAITPRSPRGFSVSWRPANRSAEATLTLRYRATAAVAVGEPRGRLEWPVLAADRSFDVGLVEVTLELPESVRTYDGTGMAEAGWVVELTPRGVDARRRGVGAGESATLLAVFDVDRTRVAQPQWEWDLDRQRQYFLALIAAGLFILVVGAGVLAQIRVQYPPAPAGATADVVAETRATRRMLARGLGVAGWAGVVFAALCAWLAHRYLSGLGPAVQAIPGSMALVAVMFLAASAWYGRMGRDPRRKST